MYFFIFLTPHRKRDCIVGEGLFCGGEDVACSKIKWGNVEFGSNGTVITDSYDAQLIDNHLCTV